jgi:hypothetical protein
MKRKTGFLGTFFLALLVLSLALAGCNNGTTDDDDDNGGGGDLWSQLTQGTGTWTPNAGGNYPSFKFENHGGGYKGCEVHDPLDRQKIAGTCELDGNTITAGSTTFQVAIENDLLTISAWSKPSEASTYNGTYKRKSGDGNSSSQVKGLIPNNYFFSGAYISLYGFDVDYDDSSLPDFSPHVTGGEASVACGFSVTASGGVLTVTRVNAYDDIDIVIDVDRAFTDGERITVSYSPDGKNIFKDGDGNPLAAFSNLSVTYIDD